jgi:DNA-binding winged helix-turn-helix (wHTH) protein/TolB-like protein
MEPNRYRFGLFEFTAEDRELRREGVLVRLQSQPAQVLACLIKRAGQVVSRDELRRTLWGSDTFVDFDRGLNFCISQIRSALEDDSAAPVYIRTIPKHGYQFIAPVEQLSESAPDNRKIGTAPRSLNARAIVLASAGVILAILTLTAGYRFLQRSILKNPPVVAVSRFDNETGHPEMDSFADGLTDSVVEQLTSSAGKRYLVIGNAQILRRTRDQRDLNAIGASLHATYVVLGQVQISGDRIRILAHLIRLPEQTHVWVVRTDSTVDDPLSVESDVAQKIVAEFSPRVSSVPNRNASLQPANR